MERTSTSTEETVAPSVDPVFGDVDGGTNYRNVRIHFQTHLNAPLGPELTASQARMERNIFRHDEDDDRARRPQHPQIVQHARSDPWYHMPVISRRHHDLLQLGNWSLQAEASQSLWCR